MTVLFHFIQLNMSFLCYHSHMFSFLPFFNLLNETLILKSPVGKHGGGSSRGRCGPWKWDLGYSEGKLYALLTKCEVEMAGYLTIILRNRAEYRLILKSDDIPRD